jgi:hypothetical protein
LQKKLKGTMKKSKLVLLGTVFMAGLAACESNEAKREWISGNDDRSSKDSSYNGNRYRYYRGGWFPVYNNMICPGYYSRGYTTGEICRPGFVPANPGAGTGGSISGVARGVQTGGFGSSGAHAEGGVGE